MKPTPAVVSPLNGMPVSLRSIKHRVSAVMIDNYPYETRPQSGLRYADIVYEAEAEGGITRYMALFLENTPSKIGPVRSTRLYFVDLARPYNAMLAHVGENFDVWGPLADLKAHGFADMEEIVGTPEAFWRDWSRNMPHNMYTSIAKLRASAPNHGWPDTAFRGNGFLFADPPPAPSASSVTIDFWRHYSVNYRYDRGTYLRSIGGVVQHDLDNPAPYRISDVIVFWTHATVLDDVGDLKMNVYGTFPAVVVRNGQAMDATWSAPGPDALPQVLDRNGRRIVLSPGQIYVEVLPQGGRVTVGNHTWTH